MDRRRSQRIQSMKKHGSSDSDSNSHDHDDKSCKVISKLLLLEDLLFHVLTLVPLTCLFNSARYVCKPWAATIASSPFAEAYERRPRSKPGLYVQNCTTTSSSYFLEFKDDVNDQFERTDLGTPQKLGYVIGSCDGILLLMSMARQISVVNPILKCWLRFPRFLSQDHIVVRWQYTIARVPRTSKFKLFLIDVLEVSGACWYVFYVLRIGIDNAWKEIAKKEAPIRWHFLWFPLYSGGNDLYWITYDKVIVMDVDKETIVREYPLPSRNMRFGPLAILLWMGNRLSCIATKDTYSTYQIYILDFDSGKWSLHHEMGPFDYVSACGHRLNTTDVKFRLWINDQIIFRVRLPQSPIGNLLPGLQYIHFGYNVKTRQLTKIEDIDVGNFEVCLHTNSLVSLPSTPA